MNGIIKSIKKGIERRKEQRAREEAERKERKLELLEEEYKDFLSVVAEPEKNRKRIAEVLRTRGIYDECTEVNPKDFLGAKLVTGPKDRKYIKQKYGILTYPSTISIPTNTWYSKEKLNELHSKHPDEYPAPKGKCRNLAGRLGLVGNSVALTCPLSNSHLAIKLVGQDYKRYYHEDFHEFWRIHRKGVVQEKIWGGASIAEIWHEFALGEIHSYHTDTENWKGEFPWSKVNKYLMGYMENYWNISVSYRDKLGEQIKTACSLLEQVKRRLKCNEIESLLLNSYNLNELNKTLNPICGEASK